MAEHNEHYGDNRLYLDDLHIGQRFTSKSLGVLCPSAIRLVPNCEGALVISRYVGPPVIVQGVREKNPSGGDIARPMSGIVGEVVECVRCACPAIGADGRSRMSHCAWIVRSASSTPGGQGR